MVEKSIEALAFAQTGIIFGDIFRVFTKQIFVREEKGKKRMSGYEFGLILLAGMLIGYLLNDMRRDMKEMREQAKKDKERKDSE